MMQLAMALLVCLAYLVMQLQSMPYRKLHDDHLACACSFSLCLMFACCVFYKLSSLTGLELLQLHMSPEQIDKFVLPTYPLTVAMIGGTLGAFALAQLLPASVVL